jgi:alkyldihydroxyacetonephosphate synthase
MIAYLRDFGFQLGLISESFETSVPWSQALTLCDRVKEKVKRRARDLLVPGEPFTSCRVTQVYTCRTS